MQDAWNLRRADARTRTGDPFITSQNGRRTPAYASMRQRPKRSSAGLRGRGLKAGVDLDRAHSEHTSISCRADASIRQRT